MEKGEQSVRKIAKSQRITARWARELYNFKRPPWSLNIDDCETPFQAFMRKMHPSKKTKFINQHIQHIEK